MISAAGEATGSVPVKFGIGADGRQIPISERIALALQIKREQQQQSESALKGRAVDGHTNGQNDSARGTPSKSRPGKNASGKSKSSTAQQGRERPDEALDLVGGSAATHEFGALDDGDEEGGGAGDGQGQGQGAQQEFMDYASPAAARKSSSSGAASRSKKAGDRKAAEGDAVDGQDEAQAAHSSGTASDWIECLDPRSKRKYYYSATLKKSTWTKPAGYSGHGNTRPVPGTPTLATMGVTMPSRYNSPNLSMHMTGRQPQQSGGEAATQRMTADELSRDEIPQQPHPARSSSLRSASPFETAAAAPSPSVQIDFAKVFSSSSRNEPAAVQAVGKTSAYSSRSSSPAPSTSAPSAKAGFRSGSPSVRTALAQNPARGAAEQDWVTAVDPNSNRKYWYNR